MTWKGQSQQQERDLSPKAKDDHPCKRECFWIVLPSRYCWLVSFSKSVFLLSIQPVLQHHALGSRQCDQPNRKILCRNFYLWNSCERKKETSKRIHRMTNKRNFSREKSKIPYCTRTFWGSQSDALKRYLTRAYTTCRICAWSNHVWAQNL